ncbi:MULTISPECIES: hopanoid biosynthesis-associated protein HpnK [Aphanothece]|uniref:hopanoid biosynthesis-associated protein HpnK n=1 Tax=Aphanothece TaxID=1121 RepID=UPI0039848E66
MVINGDDFGHSHAVNQAIIQAHTNGVLTSASLMVTGDAFAEAVELARQHPSLGVGLHLVVGTGRAVLPPAHIPHLVDANGRFPDQPVRVGLRYQFSRAARRELLLEIRAQLQRFKDTGLPLTHVDGHLHNHVHPYVLQCLIALAEEFGIRFIRLPFEELSVHRATGSRTGPGALLLWGIFRLLRAHGVTQLSAHGIGYADRVYGWLHSGRITEAYLSRLIPLIRANRVEIYAHPSLEEAGASASDSGGDGPLELQALTSPSIRHLLASCRFQGVRFPEL